MGTDLLPALFPIHLSPHMTLCRSAVRGLLISSEKSGVGIALVSAHAFTSATFGGGIEEQEERGGQDYDPPFLSPSDASRAWLAWVKTGFC